MQHPALACSPASGLFLITILITETLLWYKYKEEKLRAEDAGAFFFSFTIYSPSIFSSCAMKRYHNVSLFYCERQSIGCIERLHILRYFTFPSVFFSHFLYHFFVPCKHVLASQMPKQIKLNQKLPAELNYVILGGLKFSSQSCDWYRASPRKFLAFRRTRLYLFLLLFIAFNLARLLFLELIMSLW